MDTEAKRIVIALNNYRLCLVAACENNEVKEENLDATRAAIDSLQTLSDELRSGKLKLVREAPPKETTRIFYAVVRKVAGREYIDTSTMSGSPESSRVIARVRGDDIVRTPKCEIREVGE